MPKRRSDAMPRMPDGTVRNAPQVANASGRAPKVVSLDTVHMTVTYRETHGMQGGDFFCGLTFPYGDASCTFVVGGWGGGLVGLSSINGDDASENETRTTISWEAGCTSSVSPLTRNLPAERS